MCAEKTRVIEHDWRWMFSPDILSRAEQLVREGRYRDLYCDDRMATVIVGPRYNESNPRISSCPTCYSAGWDKKWLSCTCAASMARQSRRNRYWDVFEDYGSQTCVHEALLLILWEKKHGPWKFEESEAEKKARLRREAEEKEQLRIKLLVEHEQRRREVLRRAEGLIAADPKVFIDRNCADTKDCFFDLTLPEGLFKTSVYSVKRAGELLEGIKDTDVEPSIHYGKTGEQELQVRLMMPDNLIPNERNEVELTVGRKGLLSHYCSCRRRAYYYGSTFETAVMTPLCEHELALFVKTSEYVSIHNPGDATDKKAKDFLSLLDREAILLPDDKKAAEPLKKKDIIIEPVVTIGDESPGLSFKIGQGNNRMYQLKSLRAFADALEGETVLNLGKNCVIDFAGSDFTDESQPWIGFLMQKISDNESANEHLVGGRRWYSGSVKVSLTNREILEGATLDRFYDIMEGHECALADKNGKPGRIRVGHKSVHMEIRISPLKSATGRKLGIEVNGVMPMLIKGSMDSYMLDHTALSRISREEERALRPFERVSDPSGRIHFTIGLDNIAEFYYRVVPMLEERQFIDLYDEAGEEIGEVLPPEGKFTLKLDSDDDRIMCGASVSYGDEELELPGPMAQDGQYRDLKQEDRVIKGVTRYFPYYEQDKGFFFCEKNDENAFKLLDEGIDELNRYGKVLGTDAFHKIKLRPAPVVSVGVRIESNLLDLEVATKDISPSELIEILESYRRKKKYYRIKSGEYLSLSDNEAFDDIIGLADGLNVSTKELLSGDFKMPAYRALYLDKLLEEHEALAEERDRTFSTLIKNFKSIRDAEYELPKGLKGELRNYQTYGYKWLSTLAAAGFGGILADEMGLGKTIQTIALFEAMLEEGLTKPILVVCPASLVYNWQEEISRFAPDLRTAALTGTPTERKALAKSLGSFAQESSPHVCIISYDLLRRDIALYDKTEFKAVVIDEAQYIKNQKAAMTKAVKGLKAEKRFALTGTPIENRLAELWSIFDFLMPGFLYDYNRFLTQFETPIVKNKDEDASVKLRAMVKPFILRRLKNDVLKDLPEKLEEVRYAKMDEDQRTVYDAQVVKMKHFLEGEDKIKIFAELVRLREICCDPSLLFENYTGSSAKREACLELIESAIEGGHRMLVFSQFTSMLEILERELNDRSIPYYKITGSTAKEERLRLVHRFNDGDIPVFLISLKAGGTGLNLTGADVVIHYDPWWNLAVQNQATDRAHRIGQQNKVTVYRMIAKNTIEEKILELQEAKKDLAEEILSGEGQSIYTLSNEELLELLS